MDKTGESYTTARRRLTRYAPGRTRTEIARWPAQTHQVDGWWAQNVTVTYEQARGLRAPGQRGDGSFSIIASKTVAVPVERLYEAFADAAPRERWLPGAEIDVSTATVPKSLRGGWAGGPTRIAVGFVAKDEGRAQVGLAHERLADAEAAAEMKAYWRDRLAVLKTLLEH